MIDVIIPAVTIATTASAVNLVGNLGIRAVSQMTPSYGGAIFGGVSSTASFVFGRLTENKSKGYLYIAAITLIGGAALPHLLSPLTKQTVSLTASVGYSILGYCGAHLGEAAFLRLIEGQGFSKSFEEFCESPRNAWNYIRGH